MRQTTKAVRTNSISIEPDFAERFQLKTLHYSPAKVESRCAKVHLNSACALLFWILFAFLTPIVVEAQTLVAENGSSISGELPPAGTRSESLTLESGQLVKLTLNTRDFRLRLFVAADNGETIAEMVHLRYGPATWSFITPRSGVFKLTLTSLEHLGANRQFQLRVDEIRTASERDTKIQLAASQFDQGDVLRLRLENSDLTSAAEHYQRAALEFQKQSQWAMSARAWQQVGEVNFIRGNYRDALFAFNQAVLQSKRASDSFLTISAELQIAYVYIGLGDFARSSKLLEPCKADLQRSPPTESDALERLYAQLENNYGEVAYFRGDLKGSLQLFERSLARWKNLDDRQGMGLAHLNAGFSYLDSGRGTEAAIEFDQSLLLAREIKDLRGEALALTAQGNLYSVLGDNYAALTAHRSAREFFRRIGDRQGEAVASNGVGKVFEDFNLKQEALDNYSLALQLFQSIGNRDAEAVGAYYLGRVWRDLRDYPRALEFYQTSLTLSRQIGKVRFTMMALMDIATVYVQQGRLDDAARLFNQTLTHYQEISDLRREAIVRQRIGELYRAKAQTALAVREYERSLDLFQQIKDPQGQAESLFWLASLLEEGGNLDQAIERSRESIKIIEAQRARVVGSNWRSNYFASVHRYFELQVDILMQLDKNKPGQGYAALALQASERARARSLLELLQQTHSEIPTGVDPALLERERQLRQQLSTMGDYQLRTLNGLNRKVEGADIELRIRNLNTEYDIVQAEIKAQSPAYSQLSEPSILDLQQIQAELAQDRDTVLLEFMLGDLHSYAWLVTPTELIVKELPGRRVLEDLARYVYQGFSARQQQPDESPAKYYERYTAAEQGFCSSASSLSQILLGPFSSVLNQKRLLIVADGELLYIPFDALPRLTENGSATPCQLDANGPDYEPLLTAMQVVHLPSFSSLASLRQLHSSSGTDRDLAVWADPVFEPDDPRIAVYLRKSPQEQPKQTASNDDMTTLPKDAMALNSGPPPTRLLSSAEEARGVMRFSAAGASLLMTGFAANRESALNSNLRNYRILHFATHSTINSRYPSLSGLLLSTVSESGQTQNGLLQLNDIYGMKLNADLVVLSGCKTGLGENLSGEGLIGLTQGFLYAGSRSVVVSLWSVQDKKTEALMAEFYEAMLKDDLAPADALHRAKLKLYHQESSRHPFYWSAFVIQGEYRAAAKPWFSMFKSRALWSGLLACGIIAWLLNSWWQNRRHLAAAAITRNN
ncbi:MAG TPA: CHAT domain-containing tetratricopeptide repeat protein [Pyrinomonadaceae bacterium]